MEHGESKTILFKLFRNLPQDLKTAAHSVVAIVVLALLGIAVETALAAAHNRRHLGI